MRFAITLVLGLMPLMAVADSAVDKDFLTTWLQDSLSGAGRVVTIDGFEGALSTQSSLSQLTIADDQGVWLTLKDVKLDWSQSALLSGQIKISDLSAAEVDLERLPQSQPNTTLPAVTAQPWSLPDLPVSITITSIVAQKVVLGPSVLGQAVEARLSAQLTLSGGEGTAHLDMQRLDAGPQGHVLLQAAYSNATQVLDLSLDAAEGAGGIAASLLHIPSTPATQLTLEGHGPLTQFDAQVALATDGQPRLKGHLTLADDAQGNRVFAGELGGDLTPLFLPDYAAFFGVDTALSLKGQRGADGGVRVHALSVKSQALQLDGSMMLNAQGQPEKLNLTGRMAQEAGAVTLPFASPTPITLDSADVTLTYDQAQSDVWRFEAAVKGVSRGAFKAASATILAQGRLRDGLFDGSAQVETAGLALPDAGWAAALGRDIQGSAEFGWTAGTSALQISHLSLTAPGYHVTAEGDLGQMAAVQGHIVGHYDDVSRLSGLMGQSLSGAASFDLTGDLDPISGAFDVTGSVLGQGLGVGLAQIDALMAGESQLDLSAKRDVTGTILRALTLKAASLTANLSGSLTPSRTDLTGEVAFGDLSALGAGYSGALQGTASLQGAAGESVLMLDAMGTDLAMGQAQADAILRGESKLTASLALEPQGVRLLAADLGNDQVQASVAAKPNGAVGELALSARLTNLGLILPQFPGPVTLAGIARSGTGGMAVDLTLQGPAQMKAAVVGNLSPNYKTADLQITGTSAAALANVLIAPRSLEGGLRFDVRLRGPFALSSLSGKITLSGGRLADPTLPFGLKEMSLDATLGNGSAALTGQSAVTTGGKLGVTGNMGLTAPYPANLAFALNNTVLRNPQLYATTANGTLTLNGPAFGGGMISGTITLGKTELQIPSTNAAVAGDLPGLRHVNEPSASAATRQRAGLGPTGGAVRGGAGYGLDVTLSAPNQVFVRGRGLDAELGGTLILRGTTAKISPSGAFNLLRGRLDILGRRLVLSEAQVQLQGALVPYVHILAGIESGGIASSVLIEGDATNPAVTFTSSPDLPQEQVLAHLLFDRGIDKISAFQAAQLASAVASLAGRGGDGVMGALRRKTLLDNLDVQADGTGNTTVTAGKYLGDKAYSEVTVGQGGTSAISLNYDLGRNITAKTHADSEGMTGLGLFLTRDY